ncbi:peroxiredoxin-like family protein [Polaribacter sargassicola]|uniref:peroxiredoxin-like family protein n=1 Tax=Polaribacter sargassicola TaxID=2836891 RepID=UPI001F2CEA2D|nr:peroxiredoxin-like family protein [Polaribacter sp. DS7-9]MCG1036764.1 AhpC/TSA family protein [Polaribacter sp. DS7-9]
METNKVTLKELLSTKQKEGATKFSEEKKQIYAAGIKSVIESNIVNKAFNVGDKAPNFTLNDALNKPVSLYDQLKNGPVVLTWYRGGWCPYCNITLYYLQEKLPEFKKAGASLLALTPELPDNSIDTVEKNNLKFTVLSDIDNVIGKKYNVVFKLTDDVAAIYQDSFNLNDKNGNKNNELPLAATYVIDTTGIIKYAFLDADYRKRAEPSEIISVLKNL